jgi:hypothetical protein
MYRRISSGRSQNKKSTGKLRAAGEASERRELRRVSEASSSIRTSHTSSAPIACHTYILPFFNPLRLVRFFPLVSNNLSLLRLCGKHTNSASESAVISCVRSSAAVARNLAATKKELTIDSPELSTRAIPHFIALLFSPTNLRNHRWIHGYGNRCLVSYESHKIACHGATTAQHL